MNSKVKEKQKAIGLRSLGLSYSEISREVKASKASLSLWLRSVKLSPAHKHRLAQLQVASAIKGAQVKKQHRIDLVKSIIDKAATEVRPLNNSDLWLIGVILYWAEGSKDKAYLPGRGMIFTNSDPKMLALFLRWLVECVHVETDRIKFEIYLHDTHAYRVNAVRAYWSKAINRPLSTISRVYYKHGNINSNRKNRENTYNGLLRIKVAASSTLNRQVVGWVKGICSQCGIV